MSSRKIDKKGKHGCFVSKKLSSEQENEHLADEVMVRT